MNTAAEDQWIARAAAGSARDFARLVEMHQQCLRAFLRRLSGNWAQADDLAQEVFLTAWLQLGRYRATHPFRSWLCGIAYRKFLADRRAWWRRLKREALDASVAQDAAYSLDALLDLRKAMASFPVAQRAVLALCVAADWSHSEAAQALDIPLGTVKTHIQRGREQLMLQLAAYHTQTGVTHHE